MSEANNIEQFQLQTELSFRDRYYKFIQDHLGWLYVSPALVLLLLVVVYPMGYGMVISFFDKNFARKAVPFVGLNNYLDVIKDPVFLAAVVNTLIYMACTISLSFIMGFGLALLMRHIKWGSGIFQTALIAPMSMAPLVVGLTWRWMYNPLFGLINWLLKSVGLPGQTLLASQHTAMLSMVFVDVWEWFPLVFLIIYAGLSGLPKEPYEAAELDGAGAWLTFRRITLPLLKPVILVALLLRSVDAFRTFDLAWVLTEGGPGHATELLSLYVYRTGFVFNNIGKSAAMAQVMVIGMSIIAAFYFRFLYKEVE
jgi:multiple sugar transport system permease protein